MSGRWNRIADWEHAEPAEGLDLFVHPTQRFKTITIRMFLHRPLGTEATALALVPAILRRGCRGAVNQRKLAMILEGLYGASMGADVGKIGERQVVGLRLAIVNDRFAPKRIHALQRGLRLLSDLLLHPVRQRGVFLRDTVDQEKENLKRFIEGRKDDRATYAYERCIEEMCRDEPYGVSEYGRLEEVDALSPRTLTDLHARVLAEAPLHLFVHGDVEPEKVAGLVSEYFRFRKRAPQVLPAATMREAPAQPRRIVETMDVEQGKLVMGFRSGITLSDPASGALALANGILGAFPHSKLFVRVREALGLAYSASSFLDYSKGLLCISAGIDLAKYDEAVAAILDQLKEVQEGTFTDADLDQTRQCLIDRIRSQADHPGARISVLEEQVVNERPLTAAEMEDRVGAVGRAEILAAARRVKLDTVYFLTNAEGRAA